MCVLAIGTPWSQVLAIPPFLLLQLRQVLLPTRSTSPSKGSIGSARNGAGKSLVNFFSNPLSNPFSNLFSKLTLAATAALAFSTGAHAVSFSDIQTWVGSGPNQAALVIDFQDGKTNTSLVWGYRFSGAPTGQDMFQAIVEADPYLFASIVPPSQYGSYPLGIGYDLNHTGAFSTTSPLPFDSGGLATTSSLGSAPTDPSDLWLDGPQAYWSYYTSDNTASPTWSYAATGFTTRPLANNDWDGFTFVADYNNFSLDTPPAEPTAAVIPEPRSAAVLALPLVTLLLRRRKQQGFTPRGAVKIGAVVTTAVLATGAAAHAAVSATVVPGSLTQGTVQSSLQGGQYAAESNALNDFPLNTGGFGNTVYGVSYTNANFNGNSFGGTSNTLVAFGNGGGVTLHLDAPVYPVPNQKEIGLFTAQMINAASGALFNGNMAASILASSDGVHYVTLTGIPVANPLTYTDATTASPLNAPTDAYNYLTAAQAYAAGSGTTPATLAALTPADYTQPMPDDSLFNDPASTNADRLAFRQDSTPSTYSEVFGSSAGGNWIDLSSTGLSSISYLRLNAVSTDTGIRLDALFANPAAIPEPSTLALMFPAFALIRRTGRRN